MSVQKIPKVGRKALLEAITGFSPISGFHLHLFTNDHTPGPTDTVASYVLASFGSWSDQNVIHFLEAGYDGSDRAKVQDTARTYTCMMNQSPPVLVYGYIITTDNDAVLISAERFDDAPVVIELAGSSVTITPVLTLTSEF